MFLSWDFGVLGSSWGIGTGATISFAFVFVNFLSEGFCNSYFLSLEGDSSLCHMLWDCWILA